MDNPANSNQSLSEAIIKTIAFFDLFEFPLTAYEIWEDLDQKPSLVATLRLLDQATTAGNQLIQQKNGLYFLNGRENILATRQQRYNYTNRKIKIARRFARLFGLCPFVKTVALANIIGSHNLRDGSDIDFFIITAPQRIWLTRLYCAGLAKILNVRPTAQNKKDKVCLSFYISTSHLDLSDLRLTGQDPYFDHWRHGLFLLYNREGVYDNFLAANNLATAGSEAATPNQLSRNHPLGLWLEAMAKTIQLKIMSPALKTAMNNSDGVVINDAVLKLYWSDRRREFLEKYEQKIRTTLPVAD